MNKFVFSGLLLALAIGIWFFSRPHGSPENQMPAAVTPAVPAALPEYRKVQTAPRPPLPTNTKERLSEECRGFFNQLRGLETGGQFLEGKVALPEAGGCGQPPEFFKMYHDAYLKECLSEKTPKPTAACFLALNFYRANITEWSTQGTPLRDISDPKILADKLTANLATNPAQAAEIAERLLQIDSHLPQVRKAGALMRFVDAANNAAGDAHSPSWQKFDDAINEARKALPNEESFIELELVSGMLRDSDPIALRNRVEGMRQTQPEMADYLLSWMEYRQGHTKEALALLEGIKARGSKDPRIQESIDMIKAKQPKAHRIGVNLPNDVLAPAPN